MKTLFILILNFIVISNNIKGQITEEQKKVAPNTNYLSSEKDALSADISYKIISAPGNTWCYDIYVDGRLLIHQPNVPGLPGNEGFKTKDGAVKVAELVISKIKMGEMPPSISIEEMNKLGVI